MNNKLKTLIKIALLGAIGGVVMAYTEFPIPLIPDFLKLDFSNITALLAAFALSPPAGIFVVLLKNIIKLLLTGTKSMGIGEFADIIISSAYVFTAGYFYIRNRTKKGAVLGVLYGSLTAVILGCAMNYFFIIPAYQIMLHFPIDAIIEMGHTANSWITDLKGIIVMAVLPFNILKWGLISLIMIYIYKPLSPIMKK